MSNLTDWHGLYKKGWKGIVTPKAIAHPAKFSRALIEHIYKHCLAEGWIRPGDRILDPFGGVALGAYDAMRLGLTWIGVELEPKFCALGQANIDLWNERYAGKLPNWGKAIILQGDSRYLIQVLAGKDYPGMVSSRRLRMCKAFTTKVLRPVRTEAMQNHTTCKLQRCRQPG
jgi:hypothetical protein